MKREGRKNESFSFREKEEIYGSSFRVNNICPAAATPRQFLHREYPAVSGYDYCNMYAYTHAPSPNW